MTVVVYTDASHSDQRNISACGFVLVIDKISIRHCVVLVEGLGKPSSAEQFAMAQGLQAAFMVNGVTEITLNTDHKVTVEKIRYPKRYKKRLLHELAETIEMIKETGIHLTFLHVKAHRGNYFNNKVDESCNKALKKLKLTGKP